MNKDTTNRFNADRVNALHLAEALVAKLREPSEANSQQASDMLETLKALRSAAHFADVTIK